jgi:hypothetical protein
MEKPISVGDKVNFCDSENGIVKYVDRLYSFVVFKCNNDWENYFNYTAARCNNSKLKKGWIDEEVKENNSM